ncbi:N-acetyltransferase 16 [Branchiostoma belcheri]|nr:N-acetyltransferase 16 [Branchiostoma belcheri]
MLRSRVLSAGQRYFCRRRGLNLTPRLFCTTADKPSIPSAEQLNYRLATVEDFGQILHLSRGLFDGVDPFPYFFHEYQVDKNAAVFVAEHEGKVGCVILHSSTAFSVTAEENMRTEQQSVGASIIKG